MNDPDPADQTCPVRPVRPVRPHACYSRSGWWQTLCGLDAAHQGFGWTSSPEAVGCDDCRAMIAKGEHLHRTDAQYMAPKRGA